MKVEAVCTNEDCPTVTVVRSPGADYELRSVQLLECKSVTMTGKVGIQEDGDPLQCPWCHQVVLVTRLSRPEAQFPMGEVVVSPGAIKVLGFGGNDDPLHWMEEGAKYLARHVAGDHGSADGIDASMNATADLVDHGQPLGRIISVYNHKGDVLWVITERARDKTSILLPEEYPL